MSGKVAKNKRKEVGTTANLPKMTDAELAEFKEDYNAQQLMHEGWDEKENLLISKLGDSVSAQFNSKVTDGRLSTIVIERAARVMAQLPTGVIRALTKKNRGLGQLMSLFLTRYVQPNDNAQFKHLTKLRMVDLLSQVYGVIPVLYDLSVTDKYMGPSCHILPIRNWYPQQGKFSVDDSDHNHVETFVSNSWLKSQKGKGSWSDAVLDYVIKQVDENGGTSPAERDQNQTSVVERDRQPTTSGGKGDAGQIRLVTRYENGSDGHWKTFFPDYDNIMGRDAKSKDGFIPIVTKHHIPLIDSIYGLGAFERGKSLQYAMDSLVAMYFAGVQMSIFPPRIIQKDGVVKTSLNYAPGATWIETVKDSIRNYTVSPDGLQSFQSTYGWLTGSLLNQNGTTDTTTTAESSSDPSAGKTPQALKLQAARESAADAWDRAMMEDFLGTMYERMINLAPLTPKPFTFHIFDEEIQGIRDSGLKDVMDVFDTEKEAKVTLTKEAMRQASFKFIIDAGTTMQQDQESEHAVYDELLNKFASTPQLIPAIEADGYKVHLGELARQYVITGGAKDPEKIISKIEEAKASAAGAPGQPALPPGQAGLPAPGTPAGPSGADMAQILSGQPTQAPAPVAPPDPSKDPDHQFIMANFNRFPAATQRALIAAATGNPAVGMLPIEAEMIKNLSAPSQFDEQGIAEDMKLIEIDPTSPYGAAKDPHAHLQGSQDPNVQELYGSLMSSLPPQAGQTPPVPAGAPQ